MENPGERLVGDYLRFIKDCDFVDFNVYTKVAQGEIDVIGVSNAKRRAYVCEVVTHLTTGIQYVKNARPDTSDRLIKKFIKDVQYGTNAFPDYEVTYMLWSPVVRYTKGMVEYDQHAHLTRVENEVKSRTDITIIFVINEHYLEAIRELREFAGRETKEMKSPIMRFLQIEEWCTRNVQRDERRLMRGELQGTRPG